MPHVSPRRALLKLICCALPLLAAAPAHAATACSYPNATPVFRPWLDTALYTPFPGSTFEQGAAGWSWGGKANIVGGDSNLFLAPGSHAVEIPGGGTAKSPWVCVNATTPSMRFFVRRVSGSGLMHVQGVLSGPTGKLSSIIMPVSAAAGWQPSPVVLFPPAFMTVLSTAGYQAQFLFVADAGTTFRIDDVELDPFKGH